MKTGDSSNLNLLPSQAKFQASKMKLKATLRKYMLWVSIVWATIVVGVLVMYFGSDLVLKVQNNNYDKALASYKGMSQDIVLTQLLKYRAKVVGQVLSNRFEYSSAFMMVNSIFGDRAKVEKFELDENKQFNVEVTAGDRETVDFVEDRAAEVNEGSFEGVKSIEIIGASYTLYGNWLIKMRIILE